MSRGRRRRGSGTTERLPSGRFRVRVRTPDGVRRDLGPFGSEDEAERIRLAALVEIGRAMEVVDLQPLEVDVEKLEPGGPVPLTGDFAAGWLQMIERNGQASASDDRQRWRDYCAEQLGHLPLDQVRRGQVQAVVDAVAAKRSAETARKVRGVLARMFGFAWRREIIAENPVARVPNPKGGKRRIRMIPTDQQLAGACGVDVVPLKIRTIWIAERYTAGRSGDVLSWQWESVRLEERQVVVPNEKTGQPRVIEMPEPFHEAMHNWWLECGKPKTGWVFPSRNGGRFARRGTSFAKHLRKALAAAGYGPDTNPELHVATEHTLPCDNHSIRRLAVTMLAEAGTNQQVAMNLAGHTSSATHLKYIRLTRKMTQIPEAAVAEFGAGIGPRSWTNEDDEEEAPLDGKEKAQGLPGLLSGADGTRTRGLRRDRPAL